MSGTGTHVARREDLATFRARVKAYQSLWGGLEPPISFGTFSAALEVYDAEMIKQAAPIHSALEDVR